MKIVLNKCYGGFSLSSLAIKRLLELGYPDKDFYDRDVPRNDERLVRVVEELNKAANGSFANLAIVEIPDGVDWEIEEYDGIEWIAEKHRTWR